MMKELSRERLVRTLLMEECRDKRTLDVSNDEVHIRKFNLVGIHAWDKG